MRRLKCQVVMLPHQKREQFYSAILKDPEGFLYIARDSRDTMRGGMWTPEDWKNYELQHLYLISNRDLQVGDISAIQVEPGVWNIANEPITKKDLEVARRVTDAKVEASTDPALGLPLIPESFVEKYVQKDGKINMVMIEMGLQKKTEEGRVVTDYTEDAKVYEGEELIDYVPKVRTPGKRDSSVIIHKVKDNWSRDELFDVLWEARQIGYSTNTAKNKEILREWIANLD